MCISTIQSWEGDQTHVIFGDVIQGLGECCQEGLILAVNYLQ